MSGLTPDTPVPVGVVLHSKSRVLELQYANGETYRLPFELLRVWSPSAEVRGHGPGQETLQTGKRDVTITMIEGVGNYALQPTFSMAIPRGFTRGICCTTWLSGRTSSGANISTGSRRRRSTAILRWPLPAPKGQHGHHH